MNRILLILICLFLGLNIFLLIDKKKEEEKFSQLLYEEKINSINFENKIKEQARYIDALYSNSIPHERKAQLFKYFINKDLLKSHKVIFFYKKGTCGSCIIETLSFLNSLGEIIGDENIIIVNNKSSKNLIQEYDSPFEFLNIDTFFLDIEELNEPMVFIIDESLHLDLLYMPRLYPDFKQEYFTKVIPTYFENIKYD